MDDSQVPAGEANERPGSQGDYAPGPECELLRRLQPRLGA